MLYISPKNEYPRHYGDIQIENPNWNFGDELPSGWKEVEQQPRPDTLVNEIAYEDFPKEVNGKFLQNWIVRPMTAAELERRNAPKTAKEKLLGLGLSEIEIEAIARGLIY